MANEASGKIDDVAVSGLLGTADSLAYKVHEIEDHFHNWQRWAEKAGTPSGETHIAVPIGDSDGAGVWQLDAGNDTWGSWVQILGSSDTPMTSGMVKMDANILLVTATERNEIYFLQVAFGTSGAAALAAGTYTETVFVPASNLVDASPISIQTKRVAVGTKMWARCMCPGQNTATIDLLFGGHEYEG